ncbi:MAG: YihY/virulence factor BrkB family protein [Anaerolineae bacterium]|nr:YihY/virulence factor BrkB family protein [Anaerolineae bacterium]
MSEQNPDEPPRRSQTTALYRFWRKTFIRVRRFAVHKVWPAVKATGWVIWETLNQFSMDRAWQKSAAISFFTLISAAPLLIVVVRVAGVFYQQRVAQYEIVYELEEMVGDEVAGTVEQIIEENEDRPERGNVLNALIGVGSFLFGATSVFSNLKHALNSAFGVHPRVGRGVGDFLRNRTIAFLFTIGIGLLIVALLVFNAAIIFAYRYFSGLLPARWFDLIRTLIDVRVLRVVLRVILITILIALIFQVLPDTTMAWRDVWIGAGVTSLLMTAGQVLFGIYLSYSSIGSAYGAAGSLVVVLVWVYYSALAFFYGVEFTYVYANNYGSQIKIEEERLIERARQRLRRIRERRAQGRAKSVEG